MVLLYLGLFKVGLLTSAISVFKDELICVWWWVCIGNECFFHSIFQITSNLQSTQHVTVSIRKTRKRLNQKQLYLWTLADFLKKKGKNLFCLRLTCSWLGNWLTARLLEKFLTLLTILCDTFTLVNVVSSGLILS